MEGYLQSDEGKRGQFIPFPEPSMSNHFQILDNPFATLDQRFQAYLAIARSSALRNQDSFQSVPTLSKLAEFLIIEPATVGRMATGTNLNRRKHEVLLCLAAIAPPPLPEQSPAIARQHRAQLAERWLNNDESISLIAFLQTAIAEELKVISQRQQAKRSVKKKRKAKKRNKRNKSLRERLAKIDRMNAQLTSSKNAS